MSCLFCDIATGSVARPEPEDEVLAESASFVVKPGLGHFSLGYSLVCSRRHVPNMAALSLAELRELELVARVIVDRLEAVSGHRVVSFEHGTCSNSGAGSCLDHAHLHLLPLPGPINPTVAPSPVYERIERLCDLQRFAERKDSYLYTDCGDNTGRAYVIRDSLPGQYMRRLYCEHLGMPDSWDWGVFPFTEQIRQFISIYSEAAAKFSWTKHLGSVVVR